MQVLKYEHYMWLNIGGKSILQKLSCYFSIMDLLD